MESKSGKKKKRMKDPVHTSSKTREKKGGKIGK